MTNRPDTKTPRIFGIIGRSLDHSLSPIIHNHFLQRSGVAAAYTAFPLDSHDLAPAIAGLRALGILGVNVTNPYKEQVIPFLDKLARSAQQTGAVNTITHTRGRLIGHNTDLAGIRMTLAQRIPRPVNGQQVILLGAGGVARACLTELVRQRAGLITIYARAPHKAQEMVQSIGIQSLGKPVSIATWHHLNRTINELRPAIVVNATSTPPRQMEKILAMLAEQKERRSLIFFDVNYGVRAVPPVRRPSSVKYIDGLYMLAGQAAESFRLWTGQSLDVKAVYRYARRKLQES